MSALSKVWVWRMALRDGRRGLRALLLSMFCVTLAVASVFGACQEEPVAPEIATASFLH